MSMFRILVPAATLVIGLTAGVVTGVAAAFAAEHENPGWCAKAAKDVFCPKPEKPAEEIPEAAPDKVEAPEENEATSENSNQ